MLCNVILIGCNGINIEVMYHDSVMFKQPVYNVICIVRDWGKYDFPLTRTVM